MEIY